MKQYITLRDVSKKIGGRSRSAIYCDIAAGRLPRPITLGGKLYWPEEELDAHLRQMADAAADPECRRRTADRPI